MVVENEKVGIRVPTVLLPREDVDLSRWSIIACDQYTSQPEYWAQVEKIVGNSPSTLHLIFPEVYLEESDKESRIKKITKTMRKYLDEGILIPQKPGFIYVEREISPAKVRKGLIAELDLEKYEYRKGSQTLIRATEETILERIPPRIKIRENALIELPHIMVLIDDPDKTVIEPLADKIHNLEKLYDFELMMNGGHIRGYRVDDENMTSGILHALEKLAQPELFRRKYGVESDKGVLLFAVGDGNHSLATAKACWENIKKTLPEEEVNDHPARFALVEIVNVHDEGLVFEPIHRVVFNVDTERILDEMVEYFRSQSSFAWYELFDDKTSLDERVESLRKNSNLHVIPFIKKEKWGTLAVENPKYNLEAGTLQSFLDEYVRKNTGVKIDYIHGEDTVTSLSSREGNIGFYLPAMDKDDLFKTIIMDGVLPRKTFSMGDAEEKRFYLECRKIVKD